ncbi:MAG: AI-2E family transporter [Ruminococcus sp.]|nr:AI-2E family transporter [Ruminococcus sp.]
MEKKEIKKYLSIAAIVIGVCLIVKNLSLFGEIIGITVSAMYPLILGCAIAYVFNILLTFCERCYFPTKQKGIIAYSRRPVCLVLALGMTVAIIALILKIVIPELITAFKIISAEIPKYAIDIKDWAVKSLHDYPEIQEKIYDIEVDWESLTKNLVDFVKVGASGLITSIAEIIGALASSITHLVVAIIFAIYLLLRKDKIKEDIRRSKNAYLSERLNKSLTRIYHTANTTFKNFFVGQFTEAIILGVLCMIGMSIMKLPYAAMTGTVIGVTALVPIVGAYVGGAIGAFMICTEDPMKALIFVVFLVILQQFEGNVIYPKVVGTSIGLPGIWVLAAVTIGGGLFGITGMLLGVPVLATIYKLYHSTLREKEAAMGITSPPTEEEIEQCRKKNTRKYKLVEKSVEELKNMLNSMKNDKK